MAWDCEQCACASRVWNGRPGELICVNSPGHAGQMTRVAGADAASCRGFRARSEPPVGGEPPTPTDDRVRCIPLTKGLFAIVDAEDYEWLNQYRWRTTGGTEGYARATISGKNVFMHRLIMNPPAGKVVDHINRNRWDNRRANLRVCTQAENLRNRRSFRGRSRFKGVHWNERIRKWVASICLNRRLIHLGYFHTEIAAARAYDRKARELFGPFACLNFPQPTRIVLLSGRICARSHVHGKITIGKSEMRISKSDNFAAGGCLLPGIVPETNPNHRSSKFKTKPIAARAFGSLIDLSFGNCFVLRISDFEFGRLRASCFEFPRPLPWPTGPPPGGTEP